jgi:hypothetical protein
VKKIGRAKVTVDRSWTGAIAIESFIRIGSSCPAYLPIGPNSEDPIVNTIVIECIQNRRKTQILLPNKSDNILSLENSSLADLKFLDKSDDFFFSLFFAEKKVIQFDREKKKDEIWGFFADRRIV